MNSVNTEYVRILVVDDDLDALQLVETVLRKGNYLVRTAISAEEALFRVSRYGVPDLAIVDYRLPAGMDGPQLARALRGFRDIPIIMLTAVDDEQEIINCLDEFADDYIVKPFKPSELVARVGRVLRRVDSLAFADSGGIQVDDRLSIDFKERIATVEGHPSSLTPIESKLLQILMYNAGSTVTTRSLLHRIWPTGDVQEDRLHVHVHRLRQKLERDPAEPVYIRSQRGEGYRFVLAETGR